MQRISAHYYADIELAEVNHRTYNQTTFRVQVDMTFQNPTATANFAGILVQTPAQTGVAGGYIFLLDSLGQWQLQSVVTGTTIPIVEQGNVQIHPDQPTTIAVAVQSGELVGYINQAPVVWYNDTLNPLPGRVDLEVQEVAPSSLIFFSDFELDI
jgi:hypothetical protein